MIFVNGDRSLLGLRPDMYADRLQLGPENAMSRLKHAINPPYTRPWVERVGKLILNFSAIELESVHWLVQLSEREFEIKAMVEIPFASRVTQVMKHIDARKANDYWRRRSLRSWNEALKLAHLRNQVAHNPIIFGWSDLPEAGEPNVIGIPNIRARRASKAKWLLSADHADKSINSMVEIAKTLAELRIEWCTARDQGKAPPVKIHPPFWYRLRRGIGMAVHNFNERRRA